MNRGAHSQLMVELIVFEIARKGWLTAITGKNGQGKTSTLHSIWSALAGKRELSRSAGAQGRPQSVHPVGSWHSQLVSDAESLLWAGTNSLVVETRKGVTVGIAASLLSMN